jgi:hypothetical protein
MDRKLRPLDLQGSRGLDYTTFRSTLEGPKTGFWGVTRGLNLGSLRDLQQGSQDPGPDKSWTPRTSQDLQKGESRRGLFREMGRDLGED